MGDSTPFDKALALHQEDRMQEAVDAYRANLTTEPENEAVMLNLGQALRRLGRTEESEVPYRQATDLPASAAGAWCNLGNLSASRQNWRKPSPPSGRQSSYSRRCLPPIFSWRAASATPGTPTMR
jgi:Flp pilus assembly protein TadD